MAKVLTAHVDEHPTSSVGTWILLTVSVAVLTVMAVSVPHLMGGSGWATGEKFLYLALLGYLGASVLYVLSLAVRQSNLVAGAEALTRGGLLLHTGAIVARWVTSGHAPLSSIYEMVLVFSWAVVVLHEVAERKFEVPFLGAITLPIATLALILLQVLPGEIRPLVPALQSTWLQIHVTLAMLSYAGFTISFALALLFLIKDGVSARTFLTWTSGLVAGIYGAIVISSVDGNLAFLLPAWDAEAQEKVMLAPKAGADGSHSGPGVAVCHRPGAGGSDSGDQFARFVRRGGRPLGELDKPAFSGFDLRSSPGYCAALGEGPLRAVFCPAGGAEFWRSSGSKPVPAGGNRLRAVRIACLGSSELEIRHDRELPAATGHSRRLDL